jgi:hypothetical protein
VLIHCPGTSGPEAWKTYSAPMIREKAVEKIIPPLASPSRTRTDPYLRARGDRTRVNCLMSGTCPQARPSGKPPIQTARCVATLLMGRLRRLASCLV